VSGLLTPIKLKVSLSKFPLILRSSGLSTANEGERLISRSQGLNIILVKDETYFRLLSKIIS
jgi:hypothetical protein